VTLVVPVRVRGITVGALYLEHHEPVTAFGVGHQDALITVCTHAAAPLWNLEMEGRLLRADEQRRSLVDAQSRFIPAELLRILDLDDITLVQRGHRVERRMTVLVSDIRGYTSMLEGMSVSEAGDLAMGFLRAVELPIITNNGLLQDVRGDEVLAVFDTVPDDAVRAGLAMLRSLRDHNRERVLRGSDELRVGIGVNTGVVGLGMVGGVNRMALTVIGDSVNLAARMEGVTKRYGVNLLISEQTHAELIRPVEFHIRRVERVRVVNRGGPVTVYEVYDEDPVPLREAKRAAQAAFDTAFAWFDAGDVVRARDAFRACHDLLPGDQVAPLHLARCDAVIRGDVAPGEPVSLAQK
jgi:class 3 adenylate cyclase